MDNFFIVYFLKNFLSSDTFITSFRLLDLKPSTGDRIQLTRYNIERGRLINASMQCQLLALICSKETEYCCSWSDFEILSELLTIAVCHDSKLFLMLLFSLSIFCLASKLILCEQVHACLPTVFHFESVFLSCFNWTISTRDFVKL